MTDKEYDDLMVAYLERFGHVAPYNMGDPLEHARLVQEALDNDEPIPDEDPPEGVLI